MSCKAADLTEEDLLAKNKNYIPPSNYNISEWVKVVNSGFCLGQHFFLNDMRNQQEANNAQIALSLSAGEQEGMVSVDQEFAEQLDKEMNATPQRHSTHRKKATPQKKNTIKPAASKQQVSNLAMKQEVLNSDVKDRIDKRCPKCYGEFGKHSESGNNKGFLSCRGFTHKEGGSSSPRKT